MSDLWYMASPYTLHPKGYQYAFEQAAENAGLLLRFGVHVFSPIVYTHAVAQFSGLDPNNNPMWEAFDLRFAEVCTGIILLLADNWNVSAGMARERAWFEKQHRPVIPMEPFHLPSYFTVELPEGKK